MLFYLLFYFRMFPTGIHCIWCFTISISGETYIEPGVPYNVTCTVSEFLENRRTGYSAIISSADDITQFIIFHVATGGCFYRSLTGTPLCQSSICACDTDGLATHWIYSTPTGLVSLVAFICESKSNEGILIGSERLIPTIPSKYFTQVN